MVSGKQDAAAKKLPPWSERTRDQRIAFVAVIVSTLNVIGFMIVGSLSVPLNMILSMVVPGAGVHREDGERPLPDDWRGHMIVQMPWWVFALSGLIVLAVVVVSWSPSRRFVLPGSTRYAMQRTTPAFLTFVAALLCVVQLGTVVFYDGLLSILSPYWVGPLTCLVAALLAFRRWHLDQEPRRAAIVPLASSAKGAFIVAIISMANLVAMILLPLLIILVSQIVYLATHAGSYPDLPPGSPPLQNVNAATLWNGHLIFDLPWWFFALGPFIMLAVVIFTWTVSHRFTSKGDRRRILLNTSPLFLATEAALVFFLQLVWVPFFWQPDAKNLYLIGVGSCIAVVVLALVLWRWGPGSEAIREADRKPRGERKVSARA